jgi:putative transposase
MLLSKEQLSSVMAKHSERENGLHDLMEIMLESMMLAERREFLDQSKGNKGNGYRQGLLPEIRNAVKMEISVQ